MPVIYLSSERCAVRYRNARRLGGQTIVCEAYGSLKAPLGVFFCFQNRTQMLWSFCLALLQLANISYRQDDTTLKYIDSCDIIDTYRILLHKILKSCRSFVLFRALCQLTASQKCPCKQAFLLLVK